MKLGDALRQPDLRMSATAFAKASKLPMEDIQVDDWIWAFDKEHACICRARGGSKTRDFVNYVIWRVLRTKEKWAWLAAKGGQLSQALLYFQASVFYKQIFTLNVGTSRKTFIELIDGQHILIGIISTSNLGMRLDGIVLDEEEDMEYKQSEEVYPQIEGMLTVSTVGQMLHIGTLWIATKFNDHVGIYPSRIRSWDQLPWLVKAGKIAKIIANPAVPEWEKDLLYRCIPSSPSGLLFPNLHCGALPLNTLTNRYGFDFGGEDSCVGISMPTEICCYVTEERAFDLERFPASADSLRGTPIEAESGGYNDNSKYGAKSLIACGRMGAVGMPVTNAWKSARQQKARSIEIYVDPQRTPNTYRDLKSAVFGPDGLYLKNTTDHQCHWLDAFFHALGAKGRYLMPSENSQLVKNEIAREKEARNRETFSSRY
jgi:hypothetical protein